jgi:hypothetical protein
MKMEWTLQESLSGPFYKYFIEILTYMCRILDMTLQESLTEPVLYIFLYRDHSILVQDSGLNFSSVSNGPILWIF